jgi:hypothetical protein
MDGARDASADGADAKSADGSPDVVLRPDGSAGVGGNAGTGGSAGAGAGGNAGAGVDAGSGGGSGHCDAGLGGDACDVCVVYVKQNGGSDAKSGATWADAKATIDAGIATAGATCQVWVAEGTYAPTYKPDPFGAANTATLNLLEGTKLFGGFAGTEQSASQRDTLAHVTVVTGEIGSPTSTNDNLLVVVTTNGNNYVDGLMITRGLRGIRCTASTLTLENVRVTGNTGQSTGVGLYLANACAATVKHSRFDANSLTSGFFAGGAAIGNDAGTLSVEDTLFDTNGAAAVPNDRANGGAIKSQGAVTNPLVIRRSTFRNNTADVGGAVYATNPVTIEDSRFESNSAGGGGISVNGASIARSTFVSNGGQSGVAINASFDLRLVDSTFEKNTVSVSGGSSPLTIIGCKFSQGNGAIYALNSPTTVMNSRFEFNKSTSALFVRSPKLVVFGSVFARNSAANGAAIDFDGADKTSTISVQSSTFFGNAATMTGGAIRNSTGILSITNSILWGNSAPDGAQIFNFSGATTGQVANSDVQGAGLTSGGNLDQDPVFVDTNDASLDLRLSASSPCVDHGDAASLPADPFDLDKDGDTSERVPVDALGNPRVSGAGLDMGAFERPAGGAPSPTR